MDQELHTEVLAGSWRTLLHMYLADAACALISWQHFSAWNKVMVAILEVWRNTRNQFIR